MYQPAKDPRLSTPVIPKVLYLPRAAGKTTMLMHESSEFGYVMVVRDYHVKLYIMREAKYAGYDIPEPITYIEFINYHWVGRHIKGFLVDDVSDLVQDIARAVPVVTITLRNNNDYEE